jgi:hypothetical protein
LSENLILSGAGREKRREHRNVVAGEYFSGEKNEKFA